MKQIYAINKVFFNELGFRDGGDFFSTVFGFKGMLAAVSLQWITAFAAAVLAFTQKWVWPEAIAFWGLVILIIVDAHYGYMAAAKIKGESWQITKFWRTVSILVAHTSQLVIVNMITTDYSYFTYIGQAVFMGLFIFKLRSLLTHLKQLNLINNDLHDLLQTALGGFLTRFVSAKTAAAAEQHIQIPEAVETPEDEKVLVS